MTQHQLTPKALTQAIDGATLIDLHVMLTAIDRTRLDELTTIIAAVRSARKKATLQALTQPGLFEDVA